MSLTSELRSAHSWVNKYFKTNFSNVTDFTRKERPRIESFETKVSSELKGLALNRIGTAVDYRIRLGLGFQPEQSSVIANGITRMNMNIFGKTAPPQEERFIWSETIPFHLRQIDHESLEELAKAAMVLAQIDAGFRSGGTWSAEMLQAVRGTTEDSPPTWEDILSSAKPEETTEVLKMAELARERFNCTTCEKAILGPTFTGSNYVGGADADLIMGRRLYDIKTTLQPRERLTETVKQLIGYALLDWDNKYEMEAAGIYFARQGEHITWELEELISRTSTDAQNHLAKSRNKFKELAISEAE